MGASFCVIFESDVPRHGTLGGDNPTIEKAKKKLDRLAKSAGLRSLDEFESYDPEDVAGSFDMEVEDLNMPPVQWFEAKDGLAAVQALLAHLRAHADAIARQADVVRDLGEIEKELKDAVKAGVRFRFAIVP
jgi:hypothetical protein